MPISIKNLNYEYQMRNQELINVNQEIDLGVINSSNLKMNEPCTVVNEKANMLLGLISRNFDHKSSYVMKILYLAFVRLHLGYALQF